jgi:hypothetical protein
MVTSAGMAATPQMSYGSGKKMDLKEALSGLAASPAKGKSGKKVKNLPKKSAPKIKVS